MNKIICLSKWSTNGKNITLDISRLLSPGDSCMDVTGEVAPVGSPVVVEVWCSQETIDKIKNEYGADSVLKQWDDEKNDPPVLLNKLTPLLTTYGIATADVAKESGDFIQKTVSYIAHRAKTKSETVKEEKVKGK